MNKKITVKNDHGETCYCILSGDLDIEKQLNNWYYGADDPRGGVCIRYDGEKISIVDYFHNDTVASFEVISVESTEAETVLKWIGI